MAETTVLIEGGATNKSFVLDLLDQPEVIDASADTGWIDRVRGEGRLVRTGTPAVALAAAAIEAYEDEEEVARQRLLATAHGGRPQVAARERPPAGPQAARRRLPGERGPHRAPRGSASASSGGGAGAPGRRRDRALRRAQRPDHRQRPALPAGHRHPRPDPPGRGGRRHAPDQPRRGRRRPRPPRPRLVVATPVAVGDEVEAGAPVLVLESMKMETVLRAPFRARVQGTAGFGRQPGGDGRAAAAAGAAGDEDERGGRRRPAARGRRDRPARRAAAASAADRAERGLQDLRSLLLGFDVDPHDERRTLAGYLARARRTRRGRRARWPASSTCCRCSPTCPS